MRKLDTATLEGFGQHLVGAWFQPDQKSRHGDRFIAGRSYVRQQLYDVTFKDEFEFLVKFMKDSITGKPLTDLEAMLKDLEPRSDKVFADLLKEKLAITPDGKHIPGVIGTTVIGSRWVGEEEREVWRIRDGRKRLVRCRKPVHWHVYAGEPEERDAGSKRPDPLPEGADPWPVTILKMAANPNISAAAAIDMLDALAVLFDAGSTAATIRGRSGTQPADPDDTESGTLLFTATMNATAFQSAVDDSGQAKLVANEITGDTSADATGTLGYCRLGSGGDGAEDIMDGSVGTSDADVIFNTLSIVAGTAVDITSCQITLSQGATAT